MHFKTEVILKIIEITVKTKKKVAIKAKKNS